MDASRTDPVTGENSSLSSVLCPLSLALTHDFSPPNPDPHHDSVHNVVLVVFESADSFGSGHVGLSHHQLDVALLQTAVVQLTSRKNTQTETGSDRGGGGRDSTSSSSSLSSLKMSLGGAGGARGDEVIGTLNFSAAAL